MMQNDLAGAAPPVPERVPTLTEVIEGFGFGTSHRSVEPPAEPAADWHVDRPAARDADSVPSPEAPPSSPVVEGDGFHRALSAALDRIDVDGDARLRDALQPLIAHFTDRLVASVRADLRRELASALRDPSTGQPDRPSSPQPDRPGAGVFNA